MSSDPRPSEPTDRPTDILRVGGGASRARSVDSTAAGANTPDAPAPLRSLFPTVPGFRVVRELGRGGMGVVYEAIQEGLDRTVALKMLRLATRTSVARFRAEALAVARLNHPDIVQVYAVGEHEGEPYLVLEYCPGGTLAMRMGQAPLSPTEAAAVVARVARAVHAAHEAGVVHRDLKPANILLSGNAEPQAEGKTSQSSLHSALRVPNSALQPKVTDFGLAKLLDEQEGMTATGDVLGTPVYMAPEQALASLGPVGRATDVYALGAILFELLTGRVPFLGSSALETLDLTRTKDPPRLRDLNPDIPADLESVALQCLEKDPQRRYATAAALADDLERWLTGEPIQARRQTPLHRFGRRLQRNRWLTATAVVLLVGGLVGWLLAADAGYRVPGGETVRHWLDDREASVMRPVPTEHTVRERAAGQRKRLRENLLRRQFGTGWIGDPGFPPSSDAWTQMQCTAALCADPAATPAELAPLPRVLGEMFRPNAVYPAYVPGSGWPHYNDRQPSAESSGWAISGFGRLFERGMIPPADRQRYLDWLTLVQTDLDRHRTHGPGSEPFAGGWALFANQQDPSGASLYITVIILQGLLDLRAGGVGWRGNPAERDALIGKTAGFLVSRFDGTGWRARGNRKEDYNDGLTLLVLSQLLRAEAAGLVELPEPIVRRIPELLDDCGGRAIDYPGSFGVFDVMLLDPTGKVVSSPLRTVRFPWHPWAIYTTVGWLDRLRRTGGPRAEVVRTRRVLGHLILDLGDRMVDEIEGDLTFLLAEQLVGLSAVPLP